MKATCQHMIIAKHLQKTFGQLHDWPFCSAAEIATELGQLGLALSTGEYLVVSLSRNGSRFGKASTLEGLAVFPSDGLIIPFHELERAFHEQYADYVEL